MEPECLEDCCDDLRYSWATTPEEVFEGFELQQIFIDDLADQTGFPDDVDFSNRAVLTVYLYACTTSGMVLRPNSLRLRDGSVKGKIRQRNDAVLHAPSRPVVFIETPADWVGNAELELSE